MKTPGNQKYRVLVVDDDGIVSQAIKLALIYDGHRMKSVYDGEKALAILERSVFDLIIADRAMVGIMGNDLAARVKQKWAGLPIIMTTAFATEFNLSRVTFSNVDYVLSKKFSPYELREAIDQVMGHKKPQASGSHPNGAPPTALSDVVS